jgi:hypothetical protein
MTLGGRTRASRFGYCPQVLEARTARAPGKDPTGGFGPFQMASVASASRNP